MPTCVFPDVELKCVGALGAPVDAAPRISTPFTSGQLVCQVKVMVMLPLPSAVVVNCSTMALLTAPAAVAMSKLDSTVAPLIETLK